MRKNYWKFYKPLQTKTASGKREEAHALWWRHWRAWKKVVALTARKDNAEKAKTNYKIQSVSNPPLMSMCDIGVSRARLLL